MSEQASREQVLAASLREKDAEIEYLRQRNLSLSIALESVGGQLEALRAETLQSEEPDET